MNAEINSIIESFKKFSKESIKEISKLSSSGSNRKYYRLTADNNKTFIATINKDLNENEAFFYLQSFFYNHNFSVPQIYFIDKQNGIYFQEDLGEVTFYALLQQLKNNGHFDNIVHWYQRIIDDLLLFQFSSFKGLDFSKCYPVSVFDEQAIRWDLNYFKYMFLKLTYANFHEQKLEKEFNLLTQTLLSAEANYFVYRDFQSRNIMVCGNKLYYIDFQGGRKGSLFYDVASLLYDAKAELTESIRAQLLHDYLSKLAQKISFNEEEYRNTFYVFVLFRILQALGAYGYRGIYEQKQHFINSIEPAFRNLTYLMEHTHISHRFPYLAEVLMAHYKHSFIQQFSKVLASQKLTVFIKSFSYKNGYPSDASMHGGGFVFDCRFLPNPAKVEELKLLTGQHTEVKSFMQQYEQVNRFLFNVYQIVDKCIEQYIERDFEYLSVAFGCTGGQHRSVYCAEELAKHIQEKYSVNLELVHLNKLNWITK